MSTYEEYMTGEMVFVDALDNPHAVTIKDVDMFSGGGNCRAFNAQIEMGGVVRPDLCLQRYNQAFVKEDAFDAWRMCMRAKLRVFPECYFHPEKNLLLTTNMCQRNDICLDSNTRLAINDQKGSLDALPNMEILLKRIYLEGILSAGNGIRLGEDILWIILRSKNRSDFVLGDLDGVRSSGEDITSLCKHNLNTLEESVRKILEFYVQRGADVARESYSREYKTICTAGRFWYG